MAARAAAPPASRPATFQLKPRFGAGGSTKLVGAGRAGGAAEASDGEAGVIAFKTLSVTSTPPHKFR